MLFTCYDGIVKAYPLHKRLLHWIRRGDIAERLHLLARHQRENRLDERAVTVMPETLLLEFSPSAIHSAILILADQWHPAKDGTMCSDSVRRAFR